jgi:hypothetical protein
MKKQCVCLFLINLFLLFSVTASMAKVEVVSILGYVEVRKHEQNYWEVAKKGMELSDEDLVRIPPKATFRARLENGDFVYYVPGQEMLIKDLSPVEKKRTVDGITRSSKATDMSRQRLQQTQKPAPLSLLTNQHVDFLLSALKEDANDASVRDFVQKVAKDIPVATDTGYPNHNIARAQHLLNMLMTKLKPPDNDQPQQATQNIQPPSITLKNGQGNDLDIVRLYLALLNTAGVEAKPRGDNSVSLFIVFNSGIPAGEVQSITVNKKLYLLEDDTVWLPIQITTSSDNFIKAWYRGSEVRN